MINYLSIITLNTRGLTFAIKSQSNQVATKRNSRPNIVARWLKLLPAVTASYMGFSKILAACPLIQLPANIPGEATEVLGPCTYMRNIGGAPGYRFQHGTALDIAAIWAVN